MDKHEAVCQVDMFNVMENTVAHMHRDSGWQYVLILVMARFLAKLSAS